MVSPRRSVATSIRRAGDGPLANQLKYGALPLSFNLAAPTDSGYRDAGHRVSSLPTRGPAAIGLFLVVVYSLLYYRALGPRHDRALIVSGVLTYAVLVMLGNQIGFTLTLAGVPGSSSRSVSRPTRSSCSSNE